MWRPSSPNRCPATVREAPGALLFRTHVPGRSLPVVALFHASINATGGAAILATFFAGVDGILVYAALAALALVVIVATRGRLGLARTDAIAAQPFTAPQPAVGSSIA
jgi:hypothetical protein